MKMSNVLLLCLLCLFSFTSVSHSEEYLLSDGNKIVFTSKDCTNCPNETIKFVSNDGKIVKKFPFKGDVPIFSYKITKDEKYLLTSTTGGEGTLRVYDIYKQKNIFELKPFGSSSTWGELGILNDNKFAILSSPYNTYLKPRPKFSTVVIYSIVNNVVSEEKRLTNMPESANRLRVSKNGNFIYLIGTNLDIYDESFKFIKNIVWDEDVTYFKFLQNEEIVMSDAVPNGKTDDRNNTDGEISNETNITTDNIKNQSRRIGNIYYNYGKYSGELIGNKADGKGIIIYNEGARYEGDWVNGERHGKGAFFWTNGERYEGDVVRNMHTGKATYFFPSGKKYEGDMLDNKITGKGKFTFPDGTTQEGFYKNGAISKEWIKDEVSGCYAYNPDNVYKYSKISWTGACVDSKISGQGTLVGSGQSRQATSTKEGIFVDGYLAEGKYSFVGFFSGSDWQKGKFTPEGVLEYFKEKNSGCYVKNFYPDNDYSIMLDARWTGGCTSGYISGPGKLNIERRNSDIQSSEGTFSNGYLVEGKRINNDGADKSWYEGKFNSDGAIVSGFGQDKQGTGLFKNNKLELSCSSASGCEKLSQLKPKISLAEESFKCEEARTLSEQLDSGDRWFSYDSCVGERTFRADLKKSNPQELYLTAGKYERSDQWYRAEKLYDLIIDRYPSSEFAVKANDKLTGAKRSSDDNSSRRNQSRQECENNKKACFAGCSTLSWEYNGMERATCENKCKEISCY